ncbi:4893_t:CDS:2 [Ambispora gerdemannii]|uniref:4893_t:CDS:1 n=1 Tax=Ambispora gerdemannii TaxID=144530 RepID=A0A9N9AVD5_9GLOM|nr:4893_t:CDS:2 [Ambispora gerdemannii]
MSERSSVFTEAFRLSTIPNEKKLTQDEVVFLFNYFTTNTNQVANAELARLFEDFCTPCKLNTTLYILSNLYARKRWVYSFIYSFFAGKRKRPEDDNQFAITEEMKTFASVLPWNKLNAIPSSQSVISLPNNICFLGSSNLGSKIFVRKAYKELWEIISIQHPGHDFLITGNPGIGKTFFNLFLLYILVGIGKTVVFQTDQETRYKFSNGAVVELTTIQHLRVVLNDPQVYYLLDTMEPQIKLCNARKIVVSSPNRERYKEYEKGKLVDTRIMPTWDLEELEILQSIIHLNTDFIKLRELYSLWGGIPRYVVEKAEMESSQRLLEVALATADFDKIIQSIGNIDSKKDVSHRLIHITCDEKYLQTGVIFASKWIADNLLDRFEQLCFEKVKSFLFGNGGQSACSGLRGQLFEAYAHKVLVRGNKSYRVRNLEDGKEFQKHFTACEHVLFTQLSNINRTEHKGKYCQPKSRTFCAIDAFILGQSNTINTLFQMTVSSNHPIKAHELEKVMNIGTSHDLYEFYFVVPPEIWNDFTKQKYVNLNDTNRKRLGHLSQITQYVLEMPLYL